MEYRLYGPGYVTCFAPDGKTYLAIEPGRIGWAMWWTKPILNHDVAREFLTAIGETCHA